MADITNICLKDLELLKRYFKCCTFIFQQHFIDLNILKTDEVISVSKLTFNNLSAGAISLVTNFDFLHETGVKIPPFRPKKRNPFQPAFTYFLRVYIAIFIPIGPLLFELHDFDLTAQNSNCSHFGQILTSVKNYHNFLNN